MLFRSPALAGGLSTTAPPGKPHTVLMTVALYYSLKSGSLIPPAPFFFLKITLAIRGLVFHTNCEIFCSSSVKNVSGSLIGSIESVDCFG